MLKVPHTKGFTCLSLCFFQMLLSYSFSLIFTSHTKVSQYKNLLQVVNSNKMQQLLHNS